MPVEVPLDSILFLGTCPSHSCNISPTHCEDFLATSSPLSNEMTIDETLRAFTTVWLYSGIWHAGVTTALGSSVFVSFDAEAPIVLAKVLAWASVFLSNGALPSVYWIVWNIRSTSTESPVKSWFDLMERLDQFRYFFSPFTKKYPDGSVRGLQTTSLPLAVSRCIAVGEIYCNGISICWNSEDCSLLVGAINTRDSDVTIASKQSAV